MTANHQLALVIRTHRIDRGYTQEVFSEKLNMCQSSYACIESGKIAITFDKMVAIASALEMDMHDMISEAMAGNKTACFNK